MTTSTSTASSASTDPLAKYRTDTTKTKKEDTNGQDRFLSLLMAQMKNQDPMNPLDNAQVTSQLAQINTVNGIQKLNDNFTQWTASMSQQQMLGATSLIGRSLLLEGQDLKLSGDGQPQTFGLQLGQNVTNLTVDIQDAKGKSVKTYSMGATSAGTQRLQWDGLDSAGKPLSGTFTVHALANNGKDGVAAQVMVPQAVLGLSRSDTGVSLLLNGGKTVDLSAAKEIL